MSILSILIIFIIIIENGKFMFAGVYNNLLMFDFLDKLSHQHPPKKQSRSIQVKQEAPIKQQPTKTPQNAQPKLTQSIEPQKETKKHISLSAQLQAGQTAALPPQILTILDKIRDQSQSRLSPLVLNLIQEQKAGVQRRVYLRQMSDNNQRYLEQILIQSSSDNRFVRHGLAQIVDVVAGSVYEDILTTNKYKIHKKSGINKQDLNLMMSSLNYIKKNDGNIRNKIGQLNLQLRQQAQKIEERSLDIVNKNSYGNDNHKNKEVQIFLKNIQNQRAQQRMRYLDELQKEKEKKRRKEFMKEIMKEKALSQRHERLVQAYQLKRRIKEEQMAASRQRDEQFKQFLKTYKKRKPLFVEKQEEFEQNFVIKQEQQIFNKLLQRKEIYAPISFQEIEDHQQRYAQYKVAKQKLKKAEKKMQKQAQKKRIQDLNELHKGKFRYYVLQDLVEKKQKQMRDVQKEKIIANKIKQKAYSMNIKQFHKPTVDPAKQMQLQSLLVPSSRKSRYQNPIRMRINSSQDGQQYYSLESSGRQAIIPQKDSKKEGQRNRRFLKQYLRDKIEKGEIKEKNQQVRSATVQKKINYLEQLKQNRKSGDLNYQTIDQQISNIKNKLDIRNLKSKAEHLDQKVRLKQEKFKYVAHKPEEQAELEKDYLSSIKAKIELLNNFD